MSGRAARWWRIGAALVGLPLLAFVLFWYALPWCVALPPLEPLPSAAVTDRHGELLGLLPGEDNYRCEPLPVDKALPPLLVRALLAVEDRRFEQHGGVDLLAGGRALRDRLLHGSRAGASTLAMQLAKIGNEAGERSWSQKLREILQARRLTMELGREQVLREYLDRADFGNLCRGAEAASLFYFGCHADELRPAQAALLAALVQAPTRLNPLRHPQAALARRNLVLRLMGEEDSCAEPLGVQANRLALPPQLTHEAGQLCIDGALQDACRRIAAEEVERLRRRNVTQAAVIVLDNRTGEVLVRLAAAKPDSPFGGQLDGCATPRSAGSTLKPFVYLLAFCRGGEGKPGGLWPGSVLADVPTLYRSADGIQAPNNYAGRYLGPVTVRQALACSQNVPAMAALNREDGAEEFLAFLRRLGYSIPGRAEDYGLGLAIGNAHVTLLEQVRAYAALARGGSLPTLRFRMEQGAGREEGLGAGQGEPLALGAHGPQHIYQITDILSDSAARAEGFGSAPMLRFPFGCAVKTGTSSNYRDNWCIGYTAQYTVGVWVGNFDNSPMQRVSGLSGAGPIFHRVFERLAEREPLRLPPRPDGLVESEIDRRTGLLPRADCPPSCRVAELALAGQEPAREGAHDARGRALLDSRYAEWLREAGQGHLYALDAAAPSDRRPQILIPAQGTYLVIDPTLPGEGRSIELRSTLPEATARWKSPTLRTYRRAGRWWAELRPGHHRLIVDDPVNGLRAESAFTVGER